MIEDELDVGDVTLGAAVNDLDGFSIDVAFAGERGEALLPGGVEQGIIIRLDNADGIEAGSLLLAAGDEKKQGKSAEQESFGHGILFMMDSYGR